MMLKIYKTLFYATLASLIWVGSMILAFFGGMITMSMWQDKQTKDEEPGHAGHVRYSGPTRRPCGDVPIPGE
jgi:hypothetical protein